MIDEEEWEVGRDWGVEVESEGWRLVVVCWDIDGWREGWRECFVVEEVLLLDVLGLGLRLRLWFFGNVSFSDGVVLGCLDLVEVLWVAATWPSPNPLSVLSIFSARGGRSCVMLGGKKDSEISCFLWMSLNGANDCCSNFIARLDCYYRFERRLELMLWFINGA